MWGWSSSGTHNYFRLVQFPFATCSANIPIQSDNKDFFNVTLACEDDRVQAHKIILGLCSPFFQHALPEKQLRMTTKICFMLLLHARMVQFRHKQLFWGYTVYSPLFQHVLLEKQLRVMIKTSLMLLLHVMMVEFRQTKLFWGCACAVRSSNIFCQKNNPGRW